MIALNWALIGLGAGLGALAGALFFAGLAWGMRIALRQTHPTFVLLTSAALRISALLVVGIWVAGQGGMMLAGFVLAFVLMRLCILVIARRSIDTQSASWN